MPDTQPAANAACHWITVHDPMPMHLCIDGDGMIQKGPKHLMGPGGAPRHFREALKAEHHGAAAGAAERHRQGATASKDVAPTKNAAPAAKAEPAKTSPAPHPDDAALHQARTDAHAKLAAAQAEVKGQMALWQRFKGLALKAAAARADKAIEDAEANRARSKARAHALHELSERVASGAGTRLDSVRLGFKLFRDSALSGIKSAARAVGGAVGGAVSTVTAPVRKGVAAVAGTRPAAPVTAALHGVSSILGGVLGAVKDANTLFDQKLTRDYGKTVRRVVFIAGQLSTPIVPLWFATIPGSTLLAQVPLAAGIYAAHAAVKGAAAAGNLARKTIGFDASLAEQDLWETAGQMGAACFAADDDAWPDDLDAAAIERLGREHQQSLMAAACDYLKDHEDAWRRHMAALAHADLSGLALPGRERRAKHS